MFAGSAVMRLDVSFDPSSPCSSPPHNPIRTVRRSLHAARLQNPQRLHHDRRAGGVVGRAGAAVPGVEVRADHHDFIGLVGAGNVRDDVERVRDP